MLDSIPPAATAAIIAGMFSYFALIVAKEHKISEFRQAWIDGLREELAEFIAAVCHVDMIVAFSNGTTDQAAKKEWQEAVREPHVKCLVSANKIFLRLHPHGAKNVKSDELIKAVEAVREALGKPDYSAAHDLLHDVRIKGQSLLKDEWERVKTGEKVYYFSKWTLAAVVVGGIIYLGASVASGAYPRAKFQPSDGASRAPINATRP